MEKAFFKEMNYLVYLKVFDIIRIQKSYDKLDIFFFKSKHNPL